MPRYQLYVDHAKFKLALICVNKSASKNQERVTANLFGPWESDKKSDNLKEGVNIALGY
jgi:hypothetical protein